MPQITLFDIASDHLPLSELTPRPQPRAKIPQRPNASNTSDKQAPQQTDPLPNTQIDIQRMRIDNTPRGQRAPAQIIRREQARRILRVCEGEVHEDALEQDCYC